MRPKISKGRVIVELEKWDGQTWVPDDGTPGIAFSGAEVDIYDRKRTKIGFHAFWPDVDTLKRLAANRSLTKYLKSYQKELK